MVNVDCGVIIYPDDCPKAVEFTADGCEDTLYYDLKDVYLDSLGRVLQLDMTLKNICPRKRVALCVTLNEVDSEGTEHKRGIKIFTIPAHYYDTCKDVKVRCVRFILPEDLNVENPGALCGTRKFAARVMANYIGYGFECCQDMD